MNDNIPDHGFLGPAPANAFPPCLIPLKRKRSPAIAHNSDDISCICGFSYDDGFSIACDDCSRWCHAACFNIMEGEVPEEFRCWECAPSPIDKDRAVKFQRARLKQVESGCPDPERTRRRVSPGVERKQRRASTAAAIVAAVPASISTPPVPHSVDNSKRKRRPSFRDESPAVIDMDEPWSLSYVHIDRDIVPHHDMREKLMRQAQHWRGITALDDQLSRTTVRPLPPSSLSSPALSLYTNPSVRPPSYAIHTSTSIASDEFITPYTSTITPSASYLSDPLNSYAHLGMPKPFVHLIGSPLDLTLDSRVAGNSARFVRNGCRPNAILRPFLCPQSSQSPQTLSFGIFALRDLKVNEEVVLGWEWDDGHVVHNLPALIEDPGAFPGASPDDMRSPEKLHHIRNQMSNILHVLSSTFTTCACGACTRNCAITQMAAFVDDPTIRSPEEPIDLGPLVGARRGFRTKEKVPFSGGLSGVEMYHAGEIGMGDTSQESTASAGSSMMTRLSSESEIPGSPAFDVNGCNPPKRMHCPPPPHNPKTLSTPVELCDNQVGNVVACEDKMPPKMRKKWIHRESEVLRESSICSPGSPSTGGVGLGIQIENDAGVASDLRSMPLPPSPSSLVLQTPSATSPSASFARLSLVSPIMAGTDTLAHSSKPSWPPLSQPSHSTIDKMVLSPSTTTAAATATKSSALPYTTSSGMDAEVGLYDLPAPRDPPKPREAEPALPVIVVSTIETTSTSTGDSPILPDVVASPTVTVTPPPESKDISSEKTTDLKITTNGGHPEDIPRLTLVTHPTPSSPSTTSDLSASEARHGTLKVKMSLKDFAIRKRKQREEERSRNSNTNLSTSAEVDVPTQDNEILGDEIISNKWADNREGPGGREPSKSKELDGTVAETTREEKMGIVGRPYSADVLICHSAPSPPSPSRPTVHTQQAKQELPEHAMLPTSDSPLTSRMNEFIVEGPCPVPSPSRQRQLSHEGSGTNDRTLPSHTTTLSSQHRLTCCPPSHALPTKLRSLNVTPAIPSPSPPNSSSTPRRSSLPPHRSSLPPSSPTSAGSQTVPFIASSARPLPSGPRALRAMNMPLNNSYRSYSSPQYIPRGPSADRDKMDWERERSWQRPRMRGPGWGR